MTDNRNREGQAAADLAQGWIATMQSMADQIQRQQQTFQQMMQELMNSYVQLLNTRPSTFTSSRRRGSRLLSGASSKLLSSGWSKPNASRRPSNRCPNSG